MMRSTLLFFVMLCALCNPVFAQSPSPEPGFTWRDYQEPAREPAPAVDIFGTLLRLGGVLALIYGGFALYRKIPGIQKSVAAVAGTGENMRVIETIRLNGSQSLHLVEVEGRRVLVGSNGQGTLTHLTTFGSAGSEPPAIDPPLRARAAFPPADPGSRFDAVLDQVQSREDDFQGTLESTIKQVISERTQRGTGFEALPRDDRP